MAWGPQRSVKSRHRTHHLLEWRDNGDHCDVLTIVDTLIYFGRLDEVLAAATKALRPGGWIFFTLEHLEQVERALEGRDWVLHPSGRYSHSQSYVERVVSEAGFVDLEIIRDTIRLEVGRPVKGLVVSARRSD